VKTLLFVIFIATIFTALIFPATLTRYELDWDDSQSVGAPDWFTMEGLVENPLNLTYAELKSFPLLSEVTMLQCVGSGSPPYGPSVVYNWTGVPLFYLLNMAKVISGDYREVVFIATDDFSSSILLETAMDPTTILAFEANGTDLEQLEGLGSGYRIVVPCRWGYKWVKWIRQIIVVDYDYKGTYESNGYSDEANIPDCILPSTTPPFESFDVTVVNTTYRIITLSNSTIDSFDFNTFEKQICSNITGPSGTTGYFYITIPKELLWCDNTEQWQVWVNNTLIEDKGVIEDTNYTYIYFTYNHSTQEVKIKGTQAVPEIPSLLILHLFMIATVLAVIVYKRKHTKDYLR